MQGRGHRLVCHPSLSNSTYMQCRRQVCGLRSRVWTLYVPGYPVWVPAEPPHPGGGRTPHLQWRYEESEPQSSPHRRSPYRAGGVPAGGGRALRASVRRFIRGSIRRVRRQRHSNQRRLSAHIPRLHPLFYLCGACGSRRCVSGGAHAVGVFGLLGYRSFTHRGRNIYYRVDNLHLLSESKSAPGVLFYFDGDHLSRVGSRLLRRTSPLRAELAQVAAEFNMLSVPVLAPGSLREPRVKRYRPLCASADL